ncbi:MAG: PLP-dependent aminotransferase family protein [Bacteroidales bacterium]
MAIDIKNYLSDNAKGMKKSAIRELLKIANKPEIISFGGGFPNTATFPVEELKEVTAELLDEKPEKILQYGATDGVPALKTQIIKRYQAKGMKCTEDNLIITTASQQAIDLVTKIFINPGDTILCGLPSYLGALQSFNAYRAQPIGIKKDEEADVVISSLIAVGKKPKFIYAIPDFQNPTGVTMDMEERKEIIEVARKYDLYIIEDSPYKDIRFEGEEFPTLYSMDPERVILLGTFSKTFCPGFRIGWALGPVEVIDHINTAKQASDLCTATFNQEIAARYMEKGYFEKNLKKTIVLYRHKRDLMHECLSKYMPKGVTWTRPSGGLFLFVTLPEGMDATKLFDYAIKENVAFVIGEVFFCDGTGQNTLRLNFSYVSDEQMDEGIKRLAKAIKKMI